MMPVDIIKDNTIKERLIKYLCNSKHLYVGIVEDISLVGGRAENGHVFLLVFLVEFLYILFFFMFI